MAFDKTVSVYGKKLDKKSRKSVRTLLAHKPYKCIIMGKPTRKFFLRSGKVFFDDGTECEPKDMPKEVVEIIKGMTEEGKRVYGVPKGV